MTDVPCETEATPLLASVRAARRIGDVRETARLAGECVRVAEAVRDAESAFHGATAPGMLRLSRAEPYEAREWFNAALDVARTYGLREWFGAAFHNCFIAARDSRDCRTAGRNAGAALEAYADNWQGHRIPPLTADINEGALTAEPSLPQAWAALSCWRGTVYNARTVRERLISFVNLMSAAALLNHRRHFFAAADCFQEALNEAGELNECEDVARCLTEASVASCRIRDFPRAAAVAGDAIRVALSRGETVVAEAAGEARMSAEAERAPPPLWS